MSKIRFPEDMPKAPSVADADKMMLADASTNEAKHITFDQAKQYFTIEGQRIAPVAPGALPAGPSGQTRYMEVTAVGSWTYGGNTFTNADGYKTTLWWNGTTWSNAGSAKIQGNNGADGKTIEVFNPTKTGGYAVGDSIYFSENGEKSQYIVIADAAMGESPATHPDKFEIVGSNIELDVPGGALSVDKYLANEKIGVKVEFTFTGSYWNTANSVTNLANRNRTGDVTLYKGDVVNYKLAGATGNMALFILIPAGQAPQNLILGSDYPNTIAEGSYTVTDEKAVMRLSNNTAVLPNPIVTVKKKGKVYAEETDVSTEDIKAYAKETANKAIDDTTHAFVNNISVRVYEYDVKKDDSFYILVGGRSSSVGAYLYSEDADLNTGTGFIQDLTPEITVNGVYEYRFIVPQDGKLVIQNFTPSLAIANVKILKVPKIWSLVTSYEDLIGYKDGNVAVKTNLRGNKNEIINHYFFDSLTRSQERKIEDSYVISDWQTEKVSHQNMIYADTMRTGDIYCCYNASYNTPKEDSNSAVIKMTRFNVLNPDKLLNDFTVFKKGDIVGGFEMATNKRAPYEPWIKFNTDTTFNIYFTAVNKNDDHGTRWVYRVYDRANHTFDNIIHDVYLKWDTTPQLFSSNAITDMFNSITGSSLPYQDGTIIPQTILNFELYNGWYYCVFSAGDMNNTGGIKNFILKTQDYITFEYVSRHPSDTGTAYAESTAKIIGDRMYIIYRHNTSYLFRVFDLLTNTWIDTLAKIVPDGSGSIGRPWMLDYKGKLIAICNTASNSYINPDFTPYRTGVTAFEIDITTGNFTPVAKWTTKYSFHYYAVTKDLSNRYWISFSEDRRQLSTLPHNNNRSNIGFMRFEDLVGF